MNRSEIFRNAWAIARRLSAQIGKSAKCFIGYALRRAWENRNAKPAADAGVLAKALVYGFRQYNMTPAKQEALALVQQVAADCRGFAADVAATIGRYKSCSEKQAWVIARAFAELKPNFDLNQVANFIYNA